MIETPLIFAAISDFAGKARGKAFPAADLEKRIRRGLGWTPTNVMISCFDTIGDTPYGALGDLLLMPDARTGAEIDFDDGGPIERFMLGDVTDLEGRPWDCCTRSILRGALARLKKSAGVDLRAAFEHEFQFRDPGMMQGEAYGLGGFTRRRRFGEVLMAALAQVGLEPETFMKEFGQGQYEITNAPAIGVKAADDAATLREVVRMTATRLDDTVTFTPIRDPAGVGNGVHVHMSFLDRTGAPATYSGARPDGMSGLTGAFVAGVLKYLDRILALTAASDISYLRLTPHRWSAAYNNLGFRDREAALRICPVTSADPDSIARQYNIEFRACDSAASPYLALAAVVHAGAQGIEEELPAPEPTEIDLSRLSEAELVRRGLSRLPDTLEQALARFEADDLVRSWFPGDFAGVYLAHKRGELAQLRGMDAAARCAAYEAVY